MRIWIFDFSDWLTWASLGIGLGVALVVMWVSGGFRRRARIGDEEMSWLQLLELFQGKSRSKSDQEAAQALEALPADQLLKKLLQQLPATRSITSMSMVEREAYIRNRRAGRRSRWNPVEAALSTGVDAPIEQGLIMRQADDGVAILTVNDHEIGSVLFISAVEAPKSVPAVGATVVQSRRAGKLWIITCQYVQEIPWNVKVWFG